MTARSLIVVLIAFMCGTALYGQEHAEPATAAPEQHGESAPHERSYFGIPGWVLKLLNMLLFFGLLGYLLKGPFQNALRGRGDRIQQQLQEARERREKSDRMAGEIQARLSRLESEVNTVLQRAAEEGERQKQELIAAANEEADKILRSAHSEVEARVRQARKELTDYAGELAAERAHKMIEQSMTDSDRRKLFDESLESISEGKP